MRSLHALARRALSLVLEAGRDRATFEEAGKDWLDKVAEDNLGASGLGKGHPEDKDELEGVVEG